jgi:hypothetical protein
MIVTTVTKGAEFRLSQPTLGVDSDRHTVQIPLGSVIKVLTGEENQERMVDVDWDGTIVKLFVQDIQVRGIPVKATHAGRKPPLT